MRGRVWLTAVGLLALAGCRGPAAATVPDAPPFVLPVEPAASAGGACRVLDFAVIKQTTGVEFRVAVATTHRSTQTCVLQTGADSRPDLVFSVTPTTADSDVFADEIAPAGGQTVPALGKAAYRITTPPRGDYGPSVEVGWLSADRRLISLRLTFAAETNRPAAEAFSPKLIALAKRVEAGRA